MTTKRVVTTGPCGHVEIKSRRSCCGCGMRPGLLHTNGLCNECQHPELADRRAEAGR